MTRKRSAPKGAGLDITVFQTYTKHTLFRVFEGIESGARHCVRNPVKEHGIHKKSFGQKLTFLELMAQPEL